ncbi:hypothetical protein [Microcystis aeruginosa]|uniref:hypothetical protein n=1 Tax=Microcystis aeruginosa TaxID=1126 RepID=UPI0027E422F0|nr:hypothetical protein [Microcystis aeruginosa]
MCDNFCLWNREMLTEKDFYDYFAEETISIGFVSTQKPEEPFRDNYKIVEFGKFPDKCIISIDQS